LVARKRFRRGSHRAVFNWIDAKRKRARRGSPQEKRAKPNALLQALTILIAILIVITVGLLAFA
jgi:hypothetical protein